jgi:hypothetical protein
MDQVRKALFLVAALMLGAFALPATAADKLFDISVTQGSVSPPGTLAAGQTSTIVVTFTNLSPAGNSVIKSVRVTAPAGVIFTSASVPAGAGTVSATPAASITVNNMPGLKMNGMLQITLGASVAATATCSPSFVKGEAFTGNSLSGTAFADINNQTQLFSTEPAYVGCDGPLACGASLDKSTGGVALGTSGHALTTRSSINADGSTGVSCVGVMTGLTNNSVDPPNTKLVWLKYNPFPTAQPDAFFETDVTWDLTTKAPQSPYSVTTSAWEISPGVLGGFAPTLFCLSATAPTSYGTLATAAAIGAPSIQVNVTGTVPTGKFSIRLGTTGTDADVVDVTKTSGTGTQTWTLATPTQFAHAALKTVVGNPFPRVPVDPLFQSQGYSAGTVAQVCAAGEDSSPAGNQKWLYSTTFFSIGGDPAFGGP